MSLTPGTRLRPYEIASPLGAARVIQIEAGVTFKAGAPWLLFTAPSGATGFDATADHQRFLVIEPEADAEPAAIQLDLNWAAGLEKR